MAAVFERYFIAPGHEREVEQLTQVHASIRKRLPASLVRERQEEEPDYECERGKCNGRAYRSISRHSGADQKGRARGCEAPERSRECEAAGAALGRILLRDPQSEDAEARASDADEQKARHEWRERVVKIEGIAEPERDENGHED